MALKKQLANMVTCARILCSIWLLMTAAFSKDFYIAYIAAGFSDMIDGTIARKTGAVTRFGDLLDSVADIVFVAAVFIKLLPVIMLPEWTIHWIALVFIIRINGIALGFMKKKRLVLEHTRMNKITGALLFCLPLTVGFIDIKYSAAIVCAMATLAAIHECCLICLGRTNE